MNQSGFGKVKPRSHISRHSEIGILVNGARYEGGYLVGNGFVVTKDMRKRGRE